MTLLSLANLLKAIRLPTNLRRLAWCLVVVASPTMSQIVIGQTSDFSGPASSGVKENTAGAALWIDHINKRGGVHGKRIELASLDDRFDPALAAKNARQLIDERGALALFLNRGTAHTEAIRPLLEQRKIALVAPSTGATAFHKPVHPWIFNVRSSYQREAERAISQLASMGYKRIAVAYVDDGAGVDGLEGAVLGFKTTNQEPSFLRKYDRSKPDFTPIVADMLRLDVQAVLFIGSARTVADGVKAIRAAGSKAQILTASNNASEGFIRLLGPHAHGTIITQVFPGERALSVPLVRQAYELAKAKGMTGVTPAMLEGFVAAKVLVEGLQRAGPSLTRQGLRDALEQMNRVDLGGLEIGYGPNDHTGIEFVELSIIGPGGKFVR